MSFPEFVLIGIGLAMVFPENTLVDADDSYRILAMYISANQLDFGKQRNDITS